MMMVAAAQGPVCAVPLVVEATGSSAAVTAKAFDGVRPCQALFNECFTE
jgi:hypothetical protein